MINGLASTVPQRLRVVDHECRALRHGADSAAERALLARHVQTHSPLQHAWLQCSDERPRLIALRD